MISGKSSYLEEITSHSRMRSVGLDNEIDGSTPPSVFIGRWNYPKVYAGPMLASEKGDTKIMDSPERWIPGKRSQEEIVSYRLGLVRCKRRLRIDDLDNKLVGTLQDVSLAENSIDSEAKFRRTPRGSYFSEDSTTYGPSGDLDRFSMDNTKWNHDLERVYYDTDLKAVDALCDLHKRGVPFSSIQKAFSTGTMGLEGRRKLVPTRWSITAVDSTLGDHLLNEIRHFDPIDSVRVHEFTSLHNYYSVILFPSAWQYQWQEAFLRIKANEEMLFGDHEPLTGKKGYSSVGGCFYSSRMAVLEELSRQEVQAGAIVLREAYRGYIPLGVFNVRENVRNAMAQEHREFEDVKDALKYVSGKLHLPLTRYISQGKILNDVLRRKQTRLDDFLKK